LDEKYYVPLPHQQASSRAMTQTISLFVVWLTAAASLAKNCAFTKNTFCAPEGRSGNHCGKLAGTLVPTSVPALKL